MDFIIDSLIDAGYYRAGLKNLSEFDKIIGGMAWTMQLFSYDIDIDVFYADTLDLGQKIALTERLVMVLIVLKCPYRIEPHQIVGLDYESLLPVIKWLIKRSAEVRREHEAFNRLLALRHYHRVTDSMPDRSEWCHVVELAEGNESREGQAQQSTEETTERPSRLMKQIQEEFKDHPQVSFVNLAKVLRANNSSSNSNNNNSNHQDSNFTSNPQSGGSIDESLLDSSLCLSTDNEDYQGQASTCFTADDDDARMTLSGDENNDEGQEQARVQLHPMQFSSEEVELNKKLDLELLATNQKILNLLRKLDSMPSPLEICQYQTRYVELHQQLISKNKEVKKLFDLHNSLGVSKHYLERELNLMESICANLRLANESESNRHSFMEQLNDIVAKIQSIRDDLGSKAASLRQKCASLSEECTASTQSQAITSDTANK